MNRLKRGTDIKKMVQAAQRKDMVEVTVESREVLDADLVNGHAGDRFTGVGIRIDQA